MLERTQQQTPDIYQILMDSLSINVAIYEAVDEGEDFIFVDFNKAAENTDGINKKDILGKRVTEVFPGVKASGIFDVFQRVYATGETEIFEPALYQDGRIKGWRKNEVIRMSDGHIIAMYEDHTEHKMLESNLESLGHIIDSNINEIYIFDCDTLKFTYANQEALNNLGYSREEILQMTPFDIKPFQTKEKCLDMLKPLCDGSKKLVVFETVHQRKDKSLYGIEVRLQYREYENSHQVIVMGTDITERKRSEQKLSENLKHLANTERLAHFGSWEWDIQTNALYWSDEIYRIFGEIPQSFASTYEIFLSYLTPEDKIRVESAINLALNQRANYEVEHEIVLKNGEVREVREIGEFVYNKDGHAVKLIGGILDITDYKNIKQALDEREKMFSQLFYQSQDGMMLSDLNGNVIDYNQAMLDLLKLHSIDTFSGKQICEFAPEFQPNGKLSSQMHEEIIQKASQGEQQRFEWQIRESTGKLNWVEISLTPIVVSGKQKLHAVWRNISQRKEMQAEIAAFNEELSQEIAHAIKKNEKQSQYMLQQSRLAQMGEMISMIAHQWRQPLASISAISGTLALDVMMDEYKKEFFEKRLEAISELSQHLSSTIDDFRGFFKEDKESKSVSLFEIVHSSLQIIATALKSKGIEIEENIDANIVLNTYPNEIIQVLLNLLKNAEEALEETKTKDPKISIQGYKIDHMAYLTIQDNAGGIPADIIDKVFDPYFSTKTKKDGTGLGLYMSKTIIEEHCRGKLLLKNDLHGAVFTIELPLDQKDKS